MGATSLGSSPSRCAYDLGHIIESHLHICMMLAANTSQPYTWAVMADADTKLSHYEGTASATRHIPARLNTYINGSAGGLDNDVQGRHSQGRLNLKDVMSSAGRPVGEGDGEVDEEQCSARLHCSRASVVASAKQPCDIHGLFGWVCPHGIPLRGMFCNMPTAEQFCYYLLSLLLLVIQRARLGQAGDASTNSPAPEPSQLHVYIDFGCRFKVTWERYMRALAEQGWLDPLAVTVSIMVNWMHGASHEMSCQLSNCGRFIQGAGHRVGEQVEQLWSLLKVGGCSIYMMPSRPISSPSVQRLESLLFLLPTGFLWPY